MTHREAVEKMILDVENWGPWSEEMVEHMRLHADKMDKGGAVFFLRWDGIVRKSTVDGKDLPV